MHVFVCLCGTCTLSPHAHLYNGQAPALGAEEVRGKLIDEDLELEER